MRYRRSDLFLSLVLLGALMLVLILVDTAVTNRIDQDARRERQAIVKALTITDLCLSTEARYTRHPSMADWHAPFQEHPLSLEHFPSGSMIAVPPHLGAR